MSTLVLNSSLKVITSGSGKSVGLVLGTSTPTTGVDHGPRGGSALGGPYSLVRRQIACVTAHAQWKMNFTRHLLAVHTPVPSPPREGARYRKAAPTPALQSRSLGFSFDLSPGQARTFRALGTTATVVVTAGSLADEAQRILRIEIDAIDRACSRFRPDSELAHLHGNAGHIVEISSLLFDALDVAYSVAERTDGAVDPTVGNAMVALGYDCDFDRIETRPSRHDGSRIRAGFQATGAGPPGEDCENTEGGSSRPRIVGQSLSCRPGSHSHRRRTQLGRASQCRGRHRRRRRSTS